MRDGRERPCTAKTPNTYIKDKKDQLWSLQDGKFKPVTKMNWLTNNDHIGLTKIAHFQSHLTHYEKPFPERLSMLGMLGRSTEVFDQLHTFQSAGQGSILAGIGSLLGQTIHSLASGGSQIIKALGAGIRDTFHGVGDLDEAVVGSISNATATVITAGTSGVSKVLSAIGGPSGIILYILVIGLYVYIIYSRVRQNSALTLNVGSNTNTKKNASPDFSAERTPPESPFLRHDTLNSFNGPYRPTTTDNTGTGPKTNTVWHPWQKLHNAQV